MKFYLFASAFILSLSALPSSAQFSSSVKKYISVQADTIALIHAKIIDGSGGPSRPDQTLVIMEGIITSMGNSANTKVPVHAKIIDCTGKTIIPGMIMMHEHLFYAEAAGDYYIGQEMPISFPQLYFAGGVTTMRTAGSLEPQTDLNLKQWIKKGEIVGPDMDVTGPYIERAGFPVPEMLHIRSSEEAAGIVNYWAAYGCTSFKVYRDITLSDLKAAISAAHQRGLKVTGHLCSVTYKEAAEAGIDNLEHGFMESSDFDTSRKENICSGNLFNSLTALDVNSKAMEQLMQLLIDKKVALTSTLTVFEPCTDREAIPGGGADALLPQVREVVEKSCRDALNHDSAQTSLFKKEMKWEKKFVKMGGTLMAGTDPTDDGRVVPGYADRHSLELLTEAGFNLPEAVKICSLNAAVYLGIAKETGTVAVGKKADLVLIGGDPETHIEAVRNTEIVFKNGVGFDSKKLFGSLRGTVGRY
ncbi:MAG TPA: amidohydrolase family protein, partial [Puia sp.]|nr:amidohydrolase family protein [Puia sp.]